MSRRRRSICEYVTEEWGDQLREALRLTDEHNVEHGFHTIGYPNDAYATQIRSGSEDSINLVQYVTDAYRPIKIGVHTHPSGSTIPSAADWRSFLTEYAHYPRDADFPLGWGRGLLIAAEPRWDDGIYTLTGLELTPEGTDLSKREQNDLTNRGFTTELMQSAENMAGDIGPEVSVCKETIPKL